MSKRYCDFDYAKWILDEDVVYTIQFNIGDPTDSDRLAISSPHGDFVSDFPKAIWFQVDGAVLYSNWSLGIDGYDL